MSAPTTFGRSDKELFFEALELATAEERAAFLGVVCAPDPEQRKRVEDLLARHFRERSFMAQPAALDDKLGSTEADEAIGSVIGRYRLVEKLGEGGFGVVYVAEQKTPVKRRVALKIIKLGMDTRQVVARFEAEQQALAVMDHPNIAQVFDAGATEKGRPYFVMELVRGLPITKYCDENALTTSERLNLFVQVSKAIEHAHQKGIIHRDIKPSNILVSSHDGVATPKVIDFGIAKATQGSLSEKTIYTEMQQLIGTPAYMSPEQAEMSGLAIDTRTDIYALGVLLYEMLVGETPFDAKELARSGLDNMRRTIRTKEPQRPSTRLLRAGTAPEKTVKERAELSRYLRGDLDWIVMKCLEKDRTRRYATAHELTADLERHLANEPVLARPPTLAYQLQKTWQRNRLMIASASVVATVLIVATAVSVWLAVVATGARKEAQGLQKTESDLRRRADAQKGEAERNLYAAKMSLAPLSWAQNDFIRLDQILDETKNSRDRGFEWGYWRRQAREALRVFRGHALDVRAASFSPDAKRLATAGEDGVAIVWDVATGAELVTFAKHPDFLAGLIWSQDGKWILSSSTHQIRGWDPQTGRELFTITNRSARVGAIALSKDGALIGAGCLDGAGRVFRASDQKLVMEVATGKGVRAAGFSPDGTLIAFGKIDGTATIYDVATGKPTVDLKGHKPGEWIRCVAFSPDGQRIVTASDDHTAKVWSVATGRLLFNLDAHGFYVAGAAYSPVGKYIATASFDWTTKLWNAEDGRELQTFKGHMRDVNSVSFSADGSKMATTAYDQATIVWNLNPHDGKFRIAGKTPVSVAAFSADCEFVAAPGEDGSVRILETSGGREIKRLKISGAEVSALAFSEDGKRLACGAVDGTGAILDLESGRSLPLASRHENEVLSVAWSPDGTQVATGGKDWSLKVFDSTTGKVLWEFKTLLGPIASMAFSHDARMIGIGTLDATVALYDAKNGTLLRKMLGHDAGVWTVAFSPDDTQIASGSWDRMAKLWDTETGREIQTLRGHGGWLRSLAYSPDGHRIVSGAEDRTASLWNVADGRLLLTMQGEARVIRFSSDGLKIATAGGVEGKVWRAASEREASAWAAEERESLARTSLAKTNFLKAWQAKIEAEKRDPGTLRAWQLLGPFRFAPKEDPATALRRIVIDEERGATPNFAEPVKAGHETLRWQARQLEHYHIDFFHAFGAASADGIAYAFCYIDSDRARDDLRMLIGSDDESRVYLNGQLIYECVQARGFQADEDEVERIHLKPGRNALLFKVVNESAAWLGSIRLTDAEGKPPRGIHFEN